MKKRTIAMIVSLVLALALGLGGTLAYLSDTDADVNTMVLGNVQIVQNEQEWNADKTALKAFTNDKPLIPYVGTLGWENTDDQNGAYRRFTMSNVVDKYVTVTNTGNSDAYVRTIIALEMGSYAYNEFNRIGVSVNKEKGDEFKFPGAWVWPIDTTAEIDGKQYNIMVAVHQNAVKPGETTIPSLLQVYLSKDADNADVQELDGNKNGKYDILVLSQAVQAAGFSDAETALNEAFGEVVAENVAKWFKAPLEVGSPGDKNDTNNPVRAGDDDSVTYDIPTDATRVTNSDELKAALNNNVSTILLEDGEYNWSGTGHNGTAQTVSIYGKSKDAILYHTFEGEGNTDYDFDGYNVNFYGLTISGEKNGASYPGWARMSATYNDCVIKQTYGLYAGTHTFNYCTLNVTGDQYNLWTWGAENATFNNCTFNSDGKAVLLYGQANTKLTINNCLFNDNGGLTDKKAAVEIGNDYNKSYELIVNNTKVNGYEINDNGINTGTTLWGNKNSMGTDKLNVVVDGVDVY